jgi:hypothetical protein
MSKIVCVQQIFCPTKQMFDFNVNSVVSLAEYLKANNYNDVDLVFGGFGQPHYINKLISLYKKYFTGRCKFHKFEDNFGKAFMVNHMVNQYLSQHPETKYIFTFDGDIIFENTKESEKMFERLEQINLNRKCSNGLIAVNMHGDNPHWLHKFDCHKTFGDEKVSWPSCNIGIGGGCLFISVAAWQKINGYQVVGVYAPEDAIMMRDMTINNYSICVAETIFVTHPGTQEDKEYQEWKQKTTQIRMTYENALTYNNAFWKKRQEKEVNDLVSKVSYIILYKEEFPERFDNLIMLLEMLEKYFGSQLEIQIIEQDTSSKLKLPFNRPNIKHTFIYNDRPFNRSWSFNVAINKTNKTVYAFADTDIIMKREQLIHAIAETEYYEAVNPFKEGMWDIIDNFVVSVFKAQKEVNENIKGVNVRGVSPGGGLIFFTKDALLKIGGWDEGFEGWGAEDDAFNFKIKSKNISMISLPYNSFHLPHPRLGPNNNPCYAANCELLGKISHMSIEQLDEYITEQLKTNGNEFKYGKNV